MKLAPRIAVALAVISSAGLAHADLVNIPSSGSIQTLLAFPDFAATPNPVNYQGGGLTDTMDTWYFNISGSVGIEMLLSVYNSVTGLTATLFSCSNTLPGSSCITPTQIGVGILAGGSEFFGLTTGSYEIQVTGNAAIGTQYVAQVQVVPLPAALWLLLSGLVGLGAAAKRRKPIAA